MGYAATSINALSMYCPDTVYNQYSGTFNGARIYLCHTTRTTLSTTFSANYSGNTPVQVLSRSSLVLSWAENQWRQIAFDNSFNYNGTDNLLIEIQWDSSPAGGLITATTYPVSGKALLGSSVSSSTGSSLADRSVFRLATTDVLPAGQLRVRLNATPATEGTTRKVFVERINGSSGAVSVNYVTKPKTALAWQDYTPKSGTLTWQNGDTLAKAIKIPILADGHAEGNESFVVQLSSPSGATLGSPYKTTVVIAANNKSGPAGGNPVASRMDQLTDALDGNALTWFTSAEAPWTKQAFVTADGVDAGVSGTAAPGQASWLQTELEGTGTLQFDWLAKGSGKDTCLLFVNGALRRILAPGYAWSHETLTLGAGDHAIRWVFIGDTGPTPGAAYVDQVKWRPDAPPHAGP